MAQDAYRLKEEQLQEELREKPWQTKKINQSEFRTLLTKTGIALKNRPKEIKDLKQFKKALSKLINASTLIIRQSIIKNGNFFLPEESKEYMIVNEHIKNFSHCLLYTSPSPRDQRGSRMPSSA